MQLDPQTLSQHDVYRLLIGCVVPRPIAWVSSVGEDDVPNLAPFSFFMGVCGDPPTIAFSSGRREGNKKDTVHNIEHTGDFVVNIVDDDLAEQMNLTAGDYPPEVDEFCLTGLTPVPGHKVHAPYVAEAPIWSAGWCRSCRLDEVLTAWCSVRSSISTYVTNSIKMGASTCTHCGLSAVLLGTYTAMYTIFSR